MGKAAAMGICGGVAHFTSSYILSFNCARDCATFTTMKFLALIFNVYLLALSFFPCADLGNCIETNSTYISLDNNENHKETENCTPFCICACCAVPIINEFANSGEAAKQIFCTRKFCLTQITYASQSLTAIWQPPKFC